jgi:hypothetical protein
VEDEKFTNVPVMVFPVTVVPVPWFNKIFCSPGCGLLPARIVTEAEAVLAKLSPATPAIRIVFRSLRVSLFLPREPDALTANDFYRDAGERFLPILADTFRARQFGRTSAQHRPSPHLVIVR